jgi:hypothetical protein
MTTETDTFAQWVILELMGHRRLAGYLTEQQIGGAAFIRIDVPAGEGAEGAAPSARGWVATQFYSAASVYCITPVTEDLARKVAATSQPRPVERWQLPPAPDVTVGPRGADDFDEDGDDDDG